MTPQRVEIWALEVARRVERGAPVEDSRVELKTIWPDDHRKAARQIAALCNASHGNAVLWVVGLDEKNGPKGAEAKELANWWPSIAKWFDGVPPNLRHNLSIPYNGVTLIALCFDSDRAPYVVTNSKCDCGQELGWEVPWREGNRTRSATRQNLLELLASEADTPEIELLEGWLNIDLTDGEDGVPSMWKWTLSLSLYIVPKSVAPTVFPRHRTTIDVLIPSNTNTGPAFELPLFSAGELSGERVVPMIYSTDGELVVRGAGRAHLTAHAFGLEPPPDEPGLVQVSLGTAGTGRSCMLRLNAMFEESEGPAACWFLEPR